MELKEVTKLQKGEKVRISGKAVEELGWQEGDMIAQFVNKAKDAVVLMRAQDVLSVEEIEKGKKDS
jgi:bifunctional DNA-binding transcriptional regulator/antitoxin component of YhaV-PrlF toxin-antitoxin module